MSVKTRRFLSLPPEIWKEIDKLTDLEFGRGGHNYVIYKILKSHFDGAKPSASIVDIMRAQMIKQ